MTKQNLLIARKGLSSFTLHMLAIILMFCDHLWATLLLQYDFLTSIGRIAFPIFAFLIVEGIHHTTNIKKYMLRLFVFAIISEIPFNLMSSGSLINPFHQNVLWTFLIAMIGIVLIEKVKAKLSYFWLIPLSMIIVIICYLLGTLLMLDYHGEGVLTVFTFYYFYGNKYWHRIGQFLILFWINCDLLGGLVYELSLGPFQIDWPQQGFALFALIPIWLYSGKQGYYNRHVKHFYYWFYPVHALLLGMASQILYYLLP